MHSAKVFRRPCSLDNTTLNRPVHEKILILDKSRPIFGLHSYVNIDKVEIFHVLRT